MAEQRNQTPAGDNTQWTTIIRPRTGWFDVDLEELWRYRDLIVMFVKRNFTVMYKQTILGPLWIILNPLITTVLFNVVFGGIAGLSTDGTPSFLFYMAGNTVWTFFASCINGTANTFVANSQVFGKVYFPRLTTPISQVLTSLINFFIQFVMYILFWVYFAVTGSGVHLTAWAFAVPLVVLEVMLLGLGVGIIVSALTTKYRDLAIAVSFGVQLWMYISPVVYPLSSLEESPRLQMLMRLNPMTAPIEVFRMGTLGTGTVEVGSLIYSLIVTAAALVLGVVLFITAERCVPWIGRALGIGMVICGAIKLGGYFSKDLFRLAFQYDLAFGILLIAVGIITLCHPGEAMTFLCVMFGIPVLADGLFKIQVAVEAKRFGIGQWWLVLLLAVLTGVIGLLLVLRPAEGAQVMVMLMGASLLLDGALNLSVALCAVKVVDHQRPDVIETDDFEIE